MGSSGCSAGVCFQVCWIHWYQRMMTSHQDALNRRMNSVPGLQWMGTRRTSNAVGHWAWTTSYLARLMA